MKSVRMNNKGFGLLFTLLMVIVITLYILNATVSGLQHSRVVTRTIQHIQNQALAEAFVQKGILMLKEYILETGSYPGLDPVGGAGNVDVHILDSPTEEGVSQVRCHEHRVTRVIATTRHHSHTLMAAIAGASTVDQAGGRAES